MKVGLDIGEERAVVFLEKLDLDGVGVGDEGEILELERVDEWVLGVQGLELLEGVLEVDFGEVVLPLVEGESGLDLEQDDVGWGEWLVVGAEFVVDLADGLGPFPVLQKEDDLFDHENIFDLYLYE